MFSVTIQDVMDNLEIIERDKIEKYLVFSSLLVNVEIELQEKFIK